MRPGETRRRPRLSQGEWSVIAIGAGIALALLYGFYAAVVAAVDRGHVRRLDMQLAAERAASCTGVGEAGARCARSDVFTADAVSLHVPVRVPKRLVRNVVMSASAR